MPYGFVKIRFLGVEYSKNPSAGRTGLDLDGLKRCRGQPVNAGGGYRIQTKSDAVNISSNMATAAVATQNPNQPADEWKNDKVSKASRDVAWYQTALSRVPDIAREIFRDYSGIPDDQITDHIHRVRDQAWDM